MRFEGVSREPDNKELSSSDESCSPDVPLSFRLSLPSIHLFFLASFRQAKITAQRGAQQNIHTLLVSRTITILRRLPRRNNTARYYCPSPFCFFSFSFSLPRVSFRRVRQFEPATHRSIAARVPRDVTGPGWVLQLLSVLVDYFPLRPGRMGTSSARCITFAPGKIEDHDDCDDEIDSTRREIDASTGGTRARGIRCVED